MNKVIMSWGKCKVAIGNTGEKDAFPEDKDLIDLGYTVDKSTEVTSDDGDSLQAKASGGEVIAEDQAEGTQQLSTQLLEPSNAIFVALGLGFMLNNELRVQTHIIPGDKAIRVTPKNKGAIGIKIPVSRISAKYSTSEENGNVLELTCKIIKTTGVDPIYMKKGADGWAVTTEQTDIAAVKNTKPMSFRDLAEMETTSGDVYLIDGNYFYSRFTTTSSLP